MRQLQPSGCVKSPPREQQLHTLLSAWTAWAEDLHGQGAHTVTDPLLIGRDRELWSLGLGGWSWRVVSHIYTHTSLIHTAGLFPLPLIWFREAISGLSLVIQGSL